jgi:hypothetical protein
LRGSTPRRVRTRPHRRAHPGDKTGAEGSWRIDLGGKAPFGFTYDAERKLVPVPEQQKALRRIRQLHAEGLSPYKISADLGERGVKLSHVIVRKIVSADRAVSNG